MRAGGDKRGNNKQRRAQKLHNETLGIAFVVVCIALGAYYGAERAKRLRSLADSVNGQLVWYANGVLGSIDNDGSGSITTHYDPKIILPDGREWFDPERNPCPPER